MLSSQEIRQGYIAFFEKKGHTYVASSPVVPQEDPTLLFTNAGMNQFKDIFLGSRTPEYRRAVNSQKCIRAGGKHNDLEEVGKDTYHHTFFEMLGNWSFGDYFKEEAISWAWELLTGVWGLPKDRLYATYFEGDAAAGLEADGEARDIWRRFLPENQVIAGKFKDNFWEMGDTGPCGPCSEIHYDGRGEAARGQVAGEKLVNQSNPDVIEVWNLVFIQYNRDAQGLTPLPARHVDTGMGFERIVRILQGKTSNYDSDVFGPLFARIQEITGAGDYTGALERQEDIAYRVLADHARTLTFAIADGALPSNEGRGYVLRRILRRAARYGLVLDVHEPFLHKLVPTIAESMGPIFPELASRAQHAANVIEAEEISFDRTLERGMSIFESDVEELAGQKKGQISGAKAFRLYDTYGFPLDLTQLMAEERGLTVDVGRFQELMQEQRSRAQASQKNAVYEADSLAERLPETDDTEKYHTTTLTGRLLGYVREDQYIAEGAVPAGVKVGLVLDRTCAYAESGGQVGDQGTITAGASRFVFEDTQRIGTATVHFGRTEQGTLAVGMELNIAIDPAREDTQRNHTATHLLQWALQQVLGSHAHQEGSLVTADYLRFDFTHPKALTAEQIHEVEKRVREQIAAAAPVSFKIMPTAEARKLGAMALFSEKYGDHVRVLAIGAAHHDTLEEAFSREFCGGTHVHNTRDIGSFKIIREESVATGVRRIIAMTGRALNEMMYKHSEIVGELTALLKATPDQIGGRVAALIEDNKKLKKQMKKEGGASLKNSAEELLEQAEIIGGAKIIVGQLPAADVDAVRSQIDWLRKKAQSAAIVLASATEEGKVLLFAAVTDDLIGKGLKAGDIVKEIAPIVGGGGGGRPQMAQAGGKEVGKIAEALKAAKEMIHARLKE